VTPCPLCSGRGHVSEDPAPHCPSVAYPTEECPRCEGSGHLDADGLPAEYGTCADPACPCGEA
jgi:DnaJ-class molecular chaperone